MPGERRIEPDRHGTGAPPIFVGSNIFAADCEFRSRVVIGHQQCPIQGCIRPRPHRGLDGLSGNFAVIAAGAVGATAVLPAAANAATTLSAIDRRVLDLWRRLTRLRSIAHSDRLRSDAAIDLMVLVEDEIAAHMQTSILALAASIMADFINQEGHFPGEVYLASLRAIRPQLVGPIAEAADRVLAREEEART